VIIKSVAVLLLQASVPETALPPIPIEGMSSNYPAITDPDAKTVSDLEEMGLKNTFSNERWFPCMDGCIRVGFTSERFFGLEEPGKRFIYVCPNPVRNVVVSEGFPAPSSISSGDWKCAPLKRAENG